MNELGNEVRRSDSRALRLLARGLVDRDNAKLEVFLKLARDNLRFQWQLVLDGPFDVRMLAEETPAAAAANPSTSVAILELAGSSVRAWQSRRRVPIRPLQYESLLDALMPLEQLIAVPLDRAHGAPANPANEFLPTQPEMPTPSSQTPAPVAAPSAGPTYRLRRWPAAQLLLEHRYHVRLASCLSPRHVGRAELARLTNVTPEHCDAFLVKLLDADLLDVRPGAVILELSARASAAPVAARRRPATTPVRAADLGLFEKLRRRLLESLR